MTRLCETIAFPQTGQVHVWTIERGCADDMVELKSHLSPEELVRADRLRVPQRRDDFVFFRGMVRRILAHYAGIEPAEVQISLAPEGKPICQPLAFNVSHHRDLALLAVSSGRTVGIDLESSDGKVRGDALARVALSPRELRNYHELSFGERLAWLLRIWTCKEAYLKAVGCGLGRPAAEIEVRWEADRPPQLLATGDAADDPAGWNLACWSPRAGWYAAVAAPQDKQALQVIPFSATPLRDRLASTDQPSLAAG